jgi:hypothetical protein
VRLGLLYLVRVAAPACALPALYGAVSMAQKLKL